MSTSNFKNPSVYLGEVKQNTSKVVYFYLNDDHKKVIAMKSSCGCTTPVYQEKKNRLKVVYKGGKLPSSLEYQTVNQFVVIHFEDETSEKLSIHLTKIR